MPMSDKLRSQIDFIIACDREKQVLRQTFLCDDSRRENDAEHSWHMALAAMVLREYCPWDVNMEKVLRMCLVHDLVEIYAGDTFAYDAAGQEDKEAREQEAAEKLFGPLGEQGAYFRSLWEEFDAMETYDARFAASLDRFMPFLHNTQNNGRTWKIGPVTSDKVLKRMEPIRTAMPEVWNVMLDMVEESIEKGILLR